MVDWWEYPINYSNGTSVDGAGNFFMKYPSFIVGGHLGSGIILLIWLFCFVFSLILGSRKALAVSSFIAFVFSVYFVRLDMINPIVPIVLIVLMIIGLIGSSGGSY